MRPVDGRRIGLSAPGVHAAAGAPAHRKLCQRGAWQERLLGEPGLSRLTVVGYCQQVMQRGWESCHARLACTMAAFHVLVQWQGFLPKASGCVPLSMAALSL